MPRLRSIGVALSALAVVATACTTGASPTASSAGSFAVTRTTVKVTLQEWTISPETYGVVAGEVTFHITNLGSEHVHEFVILKTDLAGDALPTRPDGSVDEEDARVKVIGKVEGLPVGKSEDLTVSLDGGWYILVCNMIEGGIAHYPLEKGIPFFAD